MALLFTLAAEDTDYEVVYNDSRDCRPSIKNIDGKLIITKCTNK